MAVSGNLRTQAVSPCEEGAPIRINLLAPEFF